MKEIEVSRLSQYLQIIEENNSKFQRKQRFLYRGESMLSYTLLPSVYRKTEDGLGSEVYLSKSSERSILTDFMTEAASYINGVPVDDMFRWVEYAQHFGVPTRLLDWTSNPLVALFFACSSNPNEDGRIYILNQLFYRLLVDENDRNSMEGRIIKEEALKMILEEKNTFPYPVLFKPYYFDPRLQAQSSYFMAWGYKKEPLDALINELEEGKAKAIEYLAISEETAGDGIEVITDIHIKNEYKAHLKRELDGIGINNATLFPGLDGIGRCIEWRNNVKNFS